MGESRERPWDTLDDIAAIERYYGRDKAAHMTNGAGAIVGCEAQLWRIAGAFRLSCERGGRVPQVERRRADPEVLCRRLGVRPPELLSPGYAERDLGPLGTNKRFHMALAQGG